MKRAVSSWQVRLALTGLIGIAAVTAGGLLGSNLIAALGISVSLAVVLGLILLGNRQNRRQMKQIQRALEPDNSGEYMDAVTSPLGRLGSDFEYARRIRRNPRRYESFALRNKSIEIRDAFALAATDGAYRSEELVQLIKLNQIGRLPVQTAFLGLAWKPSVLCSLARIQANQRTLPPDLENSIAIYSFVEQVFGQHELSEADRFIFAETLGELGRFDEQSLAMKRLGLIKTHPLQVRLAELNAVPGGATDNPAEWTAKLSVIYEEFGLAKVSLQSSQDKAPLDRLRSASQDVEGPKVSVIIPTFQGGPLLKTAVQSLLDQSWTNLEIIVVDDCSGPEFDRDLKEVQELSPRVQVIRQPENLGAYSARNAGFEIASGEFVTIHDDDDWSHPDKIALQAHHLLANPQVQANMTLHCRVTESLRLVRINNNPQFSQPNFSSLMVRRGVFEEIGPWDYVNRGGDSEFRDRILAYYDQPVPLVGEMPMSFTRTWDGSLTAGELGRGYVDPARQLYYWSYRLWHRQAGKDGKRLMPQEPRRFPIPSNMRPGCRNSDLGRFDVVFATDFRFPRHDSAVVLGQMEAAQRAGLRVGFVQLVSPLSEYKDRPHSRLFELQLAGVVEQIGLTDQAEIDLMLVHEPSVATFADGLTSTLTVRKSVLVLDRSPVRGNSLAMEFNLPMAITHLDRLFGQRTLVSPTSEQIRLQGAALIPRDRMIDLSILPVVTEIPRSHPDFSQKPVLGRHGLDRRAAWPKDELDFASVYTSSQYKTVFYGETDKLTRKLGTEVLANKILLSSESSSLEDFFDQIDFWAFYDDDVSCETIEIAVASAMLAGKVVIMPPRFETTFGAAALYGEADEVQDIVAKYWEQQESYRQQSETAHNFAISRYSAKSFVQRLHALRN